MTGQREDVREATVAAVYRHACNDAAAAAIAQDWTECRRMSQIARSIADAYPGVSQKARFASEDASGSAD